MRNPARKALYCLLALIAGVALIRFGALRLERIEEDVPAVAAIALGFVLAPFGFYFLIQSLFAIRGRALLLAGYRVIARWHVPPPEWERFRGYDDRRAGEDFALGNDLWVRRARPGDPVEVIVGETSLLVDGSYHSLRPGGLPDLRGVRWLEGPPTCLEFALRYPRGRHGSPVPMTLRVPVPASGREGARRAFAHFERRLRPAPAADPRKLRRNYLLVGLLFVAAMAAVAAGWAYGAFEDPLVPMGLLIGGSILAVFALVFVLASLFLTPRGNR